MKKIFYILCTAALLMGLSTPASARSEDGDVISPALIQPLLSWIEQETGAKVPFQPKAVASHKQFQKVLVRAGGSFAGRPRSVYTAGRVLMDSVTWDESDYVQVSLLLHELVHHAQVFMPAGRFACADAREAMAYRLQNKWLEEQGHAPFVSEGWIRRMSSCGDMSRGMAVAGLGE